MTFVHPYQFSRARLLSRSHNGLVAKGRLYILLKFSPNVTIIIKVYRKQRILHDPEILTFDLEPPKT